VAHDINHVSGECSDGDVQQESNGHVVGLEVNTNHRADF
jgi:hypothetical protein